MDAGAFWTNIMSSVLIGSQKHSSTTEVIELNKHALSKVNDFAHLQDVSHSRPWRQSFRFHITSTLDNPANLHVRF